MNQTIGSSPARGAVIGHLVASPQPLSEVHACLDSQDAEMRLLAVALDELVLKLSPVIVSGELPPLQEKSGETMGRNCQLARIIEAQTDRITSMRFLVNSATANLCI